MRSLVFSALPPKLFPVFDVVSLLHFFYCLGTWLPDPSRVQVLDERLSHNTDGNTRRVHGVGFNRPVVMVCRPAKLHHSVTCRV
jgi:hypothetical protein